MQLVFGSGGVYGTMFVGAFMEFEKRFPQWRSHVQLFAGTSAGALMAAWLAVGYTTEELYKDVINTEPKEFFKLDKAGILKLKNIAKPDKLHQWIGKMLHRKKARHKTFRDMRSLIVTGFDVKNMLCKYFSYDTTPDMPIYEALCISSNIPFLFPPYPYDGSLWVDGVCFEICPYQHPRITVKEAFFFTIQDEMVSTSNSMFDIYRRLFMYIMTQRDDVVLEFPNHICCSNTFLAPELKTGDGNILKTFEKASFAFRLGCLVAGQKSFDGFWQKNKQRFVDHPYYKPITAENAPDVLSDHDDLPSTKPTRTRSWTERKEDQTEEAQRVKLVKAA